MTSVQENIYCMTEQPKPDRTTSREWARPLWLVFNIGWYVALSLVIPTGIGYWLDRPEKFNTRPLFTLIGFGIGTVLAFYGLYLMLRRFYLEQKEQEKKYKGPEIGD
jgi:F0F1-type ATP synthase assembly protein I